MNTVTRVRSPLWLGMRVQVFSLLLLLLLSLSLLSSFLGLNDKQKLICDDFVYIPQYGDGTASLNVNVATSIVLHEFSRLNK